MSVFVGDIGTPEVMAQAAARPKSGRPANALTSIAPDIERDYPPHGYWRRRAVWRSWHHE
jgi:hypothetical protein